MFLEYPPVGPAFLPLPYALLALRGRCRPTTFRPHSLQTPRPQSSVAAPPSAHFVLTQRYVTSSLCSPLCSCSLLLAVLAQSPGEPLHGPFLCPRYLRTSGESNDTTWRLTSGGPSKRRQRARLFEQATKPLDLSRGAVAYAENLLACVQRTTAPPKKAGPTPPDFYFNRILLLWAAAESL